MVLNKQLLRKVDQSHISESTNSDELTNALVDMKRQTEEDLEREKMREIARQ